MNVKDLGVKKVKAQLGTEKDERSEIDLGTSQFAQEFALMKKMIISF